MITARRKLFCAALLAVATLSAAPTTQASYEQRVEAAKRFAQDQFLRYTDDDKHPRLEVSILRLEGDDGFKLDLVSAIHIADAAYYADLNDRFKSYDAVLYELVAPDGELPEKNAPAHHPVSGLQKMLKSILGLSYQLDEVDYTAGNFVHADMDPDQFAQAQEARGESFSTLLLNAYMKQMNDRASGGGAATAPIKVRPLKFGGSPAHRQLAFKRLLAPTMGELMNQSEMIQGPDGSAILTDRNDHALEVIRDERAAGKKHIALFYGAAHMPDLAGQLTTQDKLKATRTTWLTAWDLTEPPTTLPSTRP